jgi:predicted NBD/HSP70 family sugar kinase
METPGSAAEWEAAIRRSLEKILPKPRRGEGSSLASLAASGCWGVLLSVPGIVDEAQGRVLFSPNIHWSEGVDFRRIFQDMTHLPIEIVQEIRALALGQLAAAPRQRDFLLVDFGHGVGGASIVGGALYPGALPLVGELGHTPVVGNDRRCGCGTVGCLETLLSRRGLFQSIQEHCAGGGGSVVGKYVWTVVEQHVHKQGIEPWLAKGLCAGAVIVAGAMNVLGLGRVVITGTFDTLPTYVRSIFAEEIRKATLWAKFGEVSIEFAPRRRMCGLISVGIERFVVNASR